MPSFGEKLKHEREARDKTAEEIATATGIELAYLEALERNEFHSLPGRAFGKLYIRAYAEVLGFDPQPLIDDYDRELHARKTPPTARPPSEPAPLRPVEAALAEWREARIAERRDAERVVPDAPVSVEPVDPSPPEPDVSVPEIPSRSNRPMILALVGGGALLVIPLVYFSCFRTIESESVLPPPVATPSAREVAPPEPAVTESEPPKPPRSHLEIVESGVGRKIVHRRLEGAGDRFPRGSVVWFSTRVLGGTRGERIRHVWIHEGKTRHSVELQLGGPNWRTYSRAAVHSEGEWAVEARDEKGLVLARSTFTCGP